MINKEMEHANIVFG